MSKRINIKTKAQAVAMFGSTQTAAGEAIGLSRAAMSNMVDPLQPLYRHRFTGAAIRMGIIECDVPGDISRLLDLVEERRSDELLGIAYEQGLI